MTTKRNLCIAMLSIVVFLSCDFKVSVNLKTPSNQAEVKQVNENLSFPMETGFTKEFLQANFWKCNYNSAGEALAYWVILPNNMKPVRIEPTQVEETNLLNIGRYERIDTSPYLEVWVLTETLTENVEPAEWLRNWLKTANETIIHEKEIVGSNGNKYLDVLTSKSTSTNDTSISRCTVYRSELSSANGETMWNYFFIKVSCGINDYEKLAKTIQHISSNWGVKY